MMVGTFVIAIVQDYCHHLCKNHTCVDISRNKCIAVIAKVSIITISRVQKWNAIENVDFDRSSVFYAVIIDIWQRRVQQKDAIFVLSRDI
jgi:hypothetical protein